MEWNPQGYRRSYKRVIRQRDSPSLSKTTTEKIGDQQFIDLYWKLEKEGL
jgi:hypothetical protein